MIVANEIAVFSVVCNRPRRVAALAALATAVVLIGVARTDSPGPMTEPRMLIVLVWTALAFALEVAVRTQRAYVEALAERARRADETREQEARARVAKERVRIARELHDVVAHHIAVINVHAGLARRAVGRDADVVDASLAHGQAAPAAPCWTSSARCRRCCARAIPPNPARSRRRASTASTRSWRRSPQPGSRSVPEPPGDPGRWIAAATWRRFGSCRSRWRRVEA